MDQEIMRIEREQKDIAEQINTLVIVDQESYQLGASMKISLSTFRKKINLFFDPMVSKAKSAYDEVRGTRDKYLKPARALEDNVLGKLKAYEREMEQKAEEGRREAEREKQEKIDAENEKNRKEAEVFGDDKAEKVKEEDFEAEQVTPTINKAKGLGIRKTYHAKVVDIKKLPIEYHLPDMVALNKLARDSKGTAKIEGVEFHND